MTGERYVVLGLAHARSRWFAEVSRWTTSGSIPVEFVKCLSVDELRARIDAGRPYSAALLDARLPAVDRDLLAAVADANVAGLVVGRDDGPRDWRHLGAAAHLPDGFDRATLLDALATHGRLIDEVTSRPEPDEAAAAPLVAWRGPLVAVLGRSGSGASTLAAALAQRLATDPRYAGDVLLVDLVRRAHQAVLHDARDVVPGIQEVVELHRSATPTAAELARLSFEVPSRGYRLVLGLRHPRDWVALRARALLASLDALRRTSRLVVADADPDLEGEAESGSLDVEDRHLLGRSAVTTADLVVVVATPSLTGLAGLPGRLDELRRCGVDGSRLLVVLNRAPRSVRARSELSRVVAEITGARSAPDPHLGPVFVPERRGVDALHRDLAPFPAPLTEPIGAAVLAALDRLPDPGLVPAPSAEPEPVPVAPGSLGHWREEEP